MAGKKAPVEFRKSVNTWWCPECGTGNPAGSANCVNGDFAFEGGQVEQAVAEEPVVGEEPAEEPVKEAPAKK